MNRVLSIPPPSNVSSPASLLRCADFFCGIGGFHEAALNLGLEVVFACEIDELSETRLRGNRPRRSGPKSLGQIPDEVLIEISKQVVHRLAIGMSDITDDDFGAIFATNVQGDNRFSPIGVADVGWNGCGWSVKTVKSPVRPKSEVG